MPAIIYQRTPGELFATGERTVSIFPSGLVRVEQTFICPTSNAGTARYQLAVGSNMPGDSQPAIDGLYIYPDPQEKNRSDGFTEFTVSAYGRINTTGTETLEWNVFSLSGTDPANNIQVTGIYKNQTKRVQLVLNEFEIADLSFDESSATTPVLIDGFNILNIRWTRGVASYQSTNFGVFTEVTYSIGAYKLVDYGQS
jgi:hypothetical protein